MLCARPSKYLGGGTGQRTAHQRLVFYQSLQASLARSCSDMAYQLTPTPRTTTTTTAADDDPTDPTATAAAPTPTATAAP